MQSLLPHFPDQRHLSLSQDCLRCFRTHSIRSRIHWSLSRTHRSLSRNHRNSARNHFPNHPQKNSRPSFPIPKASFPYRLSNRRNLTGHPANRFRSPAHFRHLHCFRLPNWKCPPRPHRSGFPRLPVQYEAEDQSGHQNLKSFVLLFRHMVLLVLLSSLLSQTPHSCTDTPRLPVARPAHHACVLRTKGTIVYKLLP